MATERTEIERQLERRYEAGFVSAAHTDADIAHTVDAAKSIFASM